MDGWIHRQTDRYKIGREDRERIDVCMMYVQTQFSVERENVSAGGNDEKGISW